jgi:MraZ protein
MFKTPLIGRYDYSVDEKNRLNIPSKLRKSISPEANNTVIITKSDQKCLDVYPLDKFFKKIMGKLDEFSETDEGERFYTSEKGENSIDSSIDSQGRINIPKFLLDYAGIKKDVIIIGAFNRIEIWDPDEREKYLKEKKEQLAKLDKGILP